tara:strand:+ start:398 stop:1528 length:1131 start_codon:yes stop_codon:yes gene_type:complete
MNKFKFDFNYIKKNLNKKNFLKDIYVLEKDSNKVSGDKYGGGDMFFKVIRNSFDGDDDVYGILLEEYDDKKNQEFKLKINKHQFDGTLLPKLSDNFKLEQNFDFGIESHSLISSKIQKNYLYVYCDRGGFWNERLTTIYQKHHLVDNYVKEIFKKKLNSYEFFEYIIKRDKKEGIPHHYNSYTSTVGIDYYDLYKKGKSNFLEETSKKIYKTFIFDDLVQNFDLKKFIKLLDIECKYKTTYPPFDYKKPPDLYDDLITSCVNKDMSFKKLMKDIHKSSGDLIHSAIESGTLLPRINNNFKLEKDFLESFETQTGTDFYGFQIISSKINNCLYILLDYGDSLGNQIFYCIKKLKRKDLAIKFVKEEYKKLKKNYEKF